jgi:hypothetical protein
MNTKVRFWLLAAGLVVFIVFATQMPVSRPPGVLAAQEPSQSPAPVLTFEKSGFVIHTLAYYSGRARVLSKEPYWIDHGANLAPYDLALGWGPMSDSKVLDRLSISQGSRFFSYRPDGREWPIPVEEINRNSANTHVIPANDEVAKTLRWVRRGQVVRFAGYLVEAVHPSGSKWRSSLTRDDSGSGACELLWTEKLEIVE